MPVRHGLAAAEALRHAHASRGRWPARGRRRRDRGRAAAGRRASTGAGRSATRRSPRRPGRARPRPRAARSHAASRATRRPPWSRRAGSRPRARARRHPAAARRPRSAAGSLPSASCPSVGAGGRRARPLLDHVPQPERRRARDDDPAAHAPHRHVVRERPADAPRPRPGGHDDVRGLDAAVVAEHAGHVVAASQQLAHGAARADLGAGGARVLGQHGRGGAGIDAARVLVDPAATRRRARAAARARATSRRAAGSPPSLAQHQAGVGLAIEGEGSAAALVQIQQQLERCGGRSPPSPAGRARSRGPGCAPRRPARARRPRTA